MSKRSAASNFFYAVAFDKQGAADDGYGGRTTAWAQQFTCRAAFRHMRGGETVQAARLEGAHVLIVTVRASDHTRQVTPDWRMRDTRTGDVYNVRDVEPSLDRHTIDFMVQKGVAT